VPNAMPGRESTVVEIFGMDGIPPQDLMAHEMKILGDRAGDPKRFHADPAATMGYMPPSGLCYYHYFHSTFNYYYYYYYCTYCCLV
jgi:hypothetical protein